MISPCGRRYAVVFGSGDDLVYQNCPTSVLGERRKKEKKRLINHQLTMLLSENVGQRSAARLLGVARKTIEKGTRNTTKKIENLQHHLEIYTYYHNKILTI